MKHEIQAIISLYKVPFKWQVVSWYVELVRKDKPVESPYPPELLSVSGISRDEGLLRVITLSFNPRGNGFDFQGTSGSNKSEVSTYLYDPLG